MSTLALTVILQANLMRMFSFRVESTNWLTVTVPSGISKTRRRTSCSTSSTVIRIEPTKVFDPELTDGLIDDVHHALDRAHLDFDVGEHRASDHESNVEGR